MSYKNIITEFENSGEVLVGRDFRLSEGDEVVVLVSNDMSLTGAPIALMNMALVLQKKSFAPIILSPKEGPLVGELNANNLPVIIAPAEKIGKMILSVEEDIPFVVVNTAENSCVVSELNGTSLPVLWWRHEPHSYFTDELLALMPMHLYDNVQVAAAGSWCLEFVKNKRPQYVIEELLYMIPDCSGITKVETNRSGEIKQIAMIGSLESRKGQDIFLEAISKLPENFRSKCRIKFIGRGLSSDITEMVVTAAENNANMDYSPELSREEIMNVYKNIDCLVCASRDDPMPVVVTEACQFSKVIICSSNTGSASLLKKHNAGLIYDYNDADNLKECMIRLFEENEEALNVMRVNARKVYEQYFTEDSFTDKIDNIIKELKDKRNVCSKEDRTVALLLRDCENERRELIKLRKENKYLKESLETMENASFWKISKPIRMLLDTIKRR